MSNLETIRSFLGFSALINLLILTVWFLLFVFAKQWMYDIHGKWFKLSENTFNIIHYSAMAGYKLFIFFFAVVPYFVLGIID